MSSDSVFGLSSLSSYKNYFTPFEVTGNVQTPAGHAAFSNGYIRVFHCVAKTLLIVFNRWDNAFVGVFKLNGFGATAGIINTLLHSLGGGVADYINGKAAGIVIFLKKLTVFVEWLLYFLRGEYKYCVAVL